MSNIHLGAALAAGIVILSLGASAAAQPPPAAGQPQYTGAPPTDAPASSGGANDSHRAARRAAHYECRGHPQCPRTLAGHRSRQSSSEQYGVEGG